MTRAIKHTSSLTRRRFIAISAAAAGFCLAEARAATSVRAVTWSGTALGAQARIELYHPDPEKAGQLIRLALDEVRRLEGLFSLYDEQSALLRLNRAGVLEAPMPDFVALLSLAHDHHRLSNGLFDPSVQPLWNLYADHFSKPGATLEGPDEAAIAAVKAQVGMEHVAFNRDRVAFMRPRMGLTFNGIAQGFITDRAVDLLGRHGIEQSLVDIGETRAMGSRPDGAPWQVAIADPERFGASKAVLPLNNMAVATSGGYGFRFGDSESCNHIFDPRSGRCATRYASVSMVQPTAAAADAMATAACLMSESEIRLMLTRAGSGEAWIITHAGEVKVIRA